MIETLGTHHGIWNINMSSILTRLIKDAGEYCDRYASDLFYDWEGIMKNIDGSEKQFDNFICKIGFRSDGIDTEFSGNPESLSYCPLRGHDFDNEKYELVRVILVECVGDGVMLVSLI